MRGEHLAVGHIWDVPAKSGDIVSCSVGCSVGGGAQGRPPAKVYTRSWVGVGHGSCTGAPPVQQRTCVCCIVYSVKVEARPPCTLARVGARLVYEHQWSAAPSHVIFLIYNKKKITSCILLLGYYYYACIINGFCTLIIFNSCYYELLKA